MLHKEANKRKNTMLIHSEIIEGFTVELFAHPEDFSPKENFPEDCDEEIIDKIESGYYQWFIAEIRVNKMGIALASEYLGGCCYENEIDFWSTKRDSYCADMIKAAIYAAKQKIIELSN